MQLTPGTILNGRYELKGLIKAGGMGTAWMAFDHHLKISCVAKISDLKDDLPGSGTGLTYGDKVTAFEREVAFLAQIPATEKSAKLPRVTDYFVIKEKPYEKSVIIMDYIDGEDYDKIRAKRKVSELEAVDVALKVLKSLMAIHKHGVIHRDVTPSNIIRCRDEEAEVYLVDLGIGKRIGTKDQRVDSARTTVGKPGYAPIEQYKGQADERSDFYTLAQTLKVIMTGNEPQNFDEVPPNCQNKRLQAAIGRALKANMAERFATAKEMYDEFYQIYLTMKGQLVQPQQPLQQAVVPQIPANSEVQAWQNPVIHHQTDTGIYIEVKRFIETLRPPSTNGRVFQDEHAFQIDCARQERLRWFSELQDANRADQIEEIKAVLKILFRTFHCGAANDVDEEFHSALLWIYGRLEEIGGKTVEALYYYRSALQTNQDNVIADVDLRRLQADHDRQRNQRIK